MRTRKILVGVMGLVMVAGSLALAGPFRRGDVAGDSKWVLHLDVGKLKGTELGGYLLGELKSEDAERKFAAFKVIFGFDPRAAIEDVTLYGVDNKRESSVVIIRGNIDSERLVTLLRADDSYVARKYGEHVVHRWVDKKKNEESFGSVHGNGAIIISGGRVAVEKALDVMDGEVPGLSNAAGLGGLAAVEAGVFGLAAAQLVGAEGLHPSAASLKKADSVTVALSEKAGTVNANLVAMAKDEEIATQMEAVVRGVIAAGILAEEEQPELARLAVAAKVSIKGRSVSVTISYPAKDVVGFLKEQKLKKEQEQDAGHGLQP